MKCLVVLLLIAIASCQIAPSTTYDGVTGTVFNNSYVTFSGSSGVIY